MKAQFLPSLVAVALLSGGVADLKATDDVTANRPLIPPLFSLDPSSPEVAAGPLLPGDLLLADDPNPPLIEIPAANLSLFSPNDDVDGLGLGASGVGLFETFVLVFSVDRAAAGGVPPDPNLVSLGFPFNVQDQATKNQAASDAFMSLILFDRFGPALPGRLRAERSRGFNNVLVVNGGDAGGVDFSINPIGLSPSMPNPPGGQQSNPNAGSGTQPAPAPLALGHGAGHYARYAEIYFSLVAGSPALLTLPGTGSGADIYIDSSPTTPGGEMLYVAPPTLGLLPADDIDATIIFEDGTPGFTSGLDQILFSLAPGSPSLGGGLGPGEVFTSEGFGVFGLYCSAGELGLAPGDNLNLLDYVFCEQVLSCVYYWAIGYPSQCEGDLNGDGQVGLVDLAILLASYGRCEGEPDYYPGADLFGDDGCVDLADLAALLAVYGTPCP